MNKYTTRKKHINIIMTLKETNSQVILNEHSLININGSKHNNITNSQEPNHVLLPCNIYLSKS